MYGQSRPNLYIYLNTNTTNPFNPSSLEPRKRYIKKNKIIVIDYQREREKREDIY